MRVNEKGVASVKLLLLTLDTALPGVRDQAHGAASVRSLPRRSTAASDHLPALRNQIRPWMSNWEETLCGEWAA